jgi:hypothetical protein
MVAVAVPWVMVALRGSDRVRVNVSRPSGSGSATTPTSMVRVVTPGPKVTVAPRTPT